VLACWADNRFQDLKKKRKVIFQSAAKYVKEYQSAERNLIRMRRQARDHGNYFIEPSPKVVFVVRIRG
jgi:large subunit ribosomal protein L7e